MRHPWTQPKGQSSVLANDDPIAFDTVDAQPDMVVGEAEEAERAVTRGGACNPTCC